MVWLFEYTGGDIPDGCVVMGDEYGEWVVYAPELRTAMAEGCPLCEAERCGTHG